MSTDPRDGHRRNWGAARPGSESPHKDTEPRPARTTAQRQLLARLRAAQAAAERRELTRVDDMNPGQPQRENAEQEERQLMARRDEIDHAAPALESRWVVLADSIDLRLVADATDWPALAAALDRAAASGFDVETALPAIAAAEPLPERHPGRELHYRLLASCPTALPLLDTAAAGDSTGTTTSGTDSTPRPYEAELRHPGPSGPAR